MQQILIIEDDRALNQGLCKALKTDNSSMQVCSGLYASATDRQIVSCENLKDAKASGYHIYPIEQLEEKFNSSCGLRFINTWDLKTIVPQRAEDVKFEMGV